MDPAAIYERWRKTIEQLPKCLCGFCGACPYKLYSRLSNRVHLCFSCRMGLHASKLE